MFNGYRRVIRPLSATPPRYHGEKKRDSKRKYIIGTFIGSVKRQITVSALCFFRQIFLSQYFLMELYTDGAAFIEPSTV